MTIAIPQAMSPMTVEWLYPTQLVEPQYPGKAALQEKLYGQRPETSRVVLTKSRSWHVGQAMPSLVSIKSLPAFSWRGFETMIGLQNLLEFLPGDRDLARRQGIYLDAILLSKKSMQPSLKRRIHAIYVSIEGSFSVRGDYKVSPYASFWTRLLPAHLLHEDARRKFCNFSRKLRNINAHEAFNPQRALPRLCNFAVEVFRFRPASCIDVLQHGNMK